MFNYQLPTTNNLVVKLAHFVIASKYLRAYKAPSTTVEKPLQISSFLTNKANFRKSQMNVSIFSQMAYENKSNWTLGENKPNSNPIKANQTQFKANSNPIQTQSNPIFLLPKSPRLPHFSLSSFGRCFHLRCSHQYWLGSSRTNSSIALVYSAVIHSNGSSFSAHSSGKITRLTPISK